MEDELAHLNQCPWEEDWAYAEAVCKQAGNVPLEAVPLQKEYWDQVGGLGGVRVGDGGDGRMDGGIPQRPTGRYARAYAS